MDESSVWTNRLTGCPQEGNNVVIDLPLDLAHAVEIAGGSANCGHGVVRDPTPAVPGLAHGLLDREPRVDPLSLTPIRAHFRAGVTIDHDCALAPFAAIRSSDRIGFPSRPPRSIGGD
jgi:hypothetical protein